MLIVFMETVRCLFNEKRYVESDELTPEQEAALQQLKDIVIEESGDGKRAYTLIGYLNCK